MKMTNAQKQEAHRKRLKSAGLVDAGKLYLTAENKAKLNAMEAEKAKELPELKADEIRALVIGEILNLAV